MSLFLTLLVSMGYGTVRADLKGKERSVYLLTGAHALLSIANILTALSSSSSENLASFLLLFLALPLAGCNIVFFMWSMSEIKQTKSELELKKQRAKLAMYNRLTRAMDVLVAIAALLLFFSLLGLIGGAAGSRDWMARHWKSFWFLADGWSTFLVLGGSLTVAWLWRPRLHNRTFGMEEIVGEDEQDVVLLEPVEIDSKEIKNINAI